MSDNRNVRNLREYFEKIWLRHKKASKTKQNEQVGEKKASVSGEVQKEETGKVKLKEGTLKQISTCSSVEDSSVDAPVPLSVAEEQNLVGEPSQVEPTPQPVEIYIKEEDKIPVQLVVDDESDEILLVELHTAQEKREEGPHKINTEEPTLEIKEEDKIPVRLVVDDESDEILLVEIHNAQEKREEVPHKINTEEPTLEIKESTLEIEELKEPTLNAEEPKEPTVKTAEPILETQEPKEPALETVEPTEQTLEIENPKEPTLKTKEPKEPTLNAEESKEPTLETQEPTETTCEEPATKLEQIVETTPILPVSKLIENSPKRETELTKYDIEKQEETSIQPPGEEPAQEEIEATSNAQVEKPAQDATAEKQVKIMTAPETKTLSELPREKTAPEQTDQTVESLIEPISEKAEETSHKPSTEEASNTAQVKPITEQEEDFTIVRITN